MRKHFSSLPKKISCKEVKPGGLFMPLLIRKEDMQRVGYYPEGNILKGSDINSPTIAQKGQPMVSGDRVLMAKLAQQGISHVTSFDSIIYHFQEQHQEVSGWLYNQSSARQYHYHSSPQNQHGEDFFPEQLTDDSSFEDCLV